jgi:hypothetical protein
VPAGCRVNPVAWVDSGLSPDVASRLSLDVASRLSLDVVSRLAPDGHAVGCPIDTP